MVSGAHDEAMKGIAKFGNAAFDCLHRVAIVVVFNVAHILQEKRFRFFMFENLMNIKKQRPTRILKPALETTLTKGLARKAGTQYIVVRYCIQLQGCDVFMHHFWIVIELVNAPSGLVDLASHNAFRAEVGKRNMKPSNACESGCRFLRLSWG